MDFYERLKQECKKNNTTVTTLLKEFNITTGRMSSWSKGGKPNPKEVKLFADKLNVSTDFLLTGKEYNPNNKIILSKDEIEIITKYRYIKDGAKNTIRSALNELYNSQKEVEISKEPTAPVQKIKKYVAKVSAGCGEFLFPDQNDYNMITIFETSESRKADFAIEVHGESMLPIFENGDIVLVREQPSVYQNEIGIFEADGSEGFIKKYGKDRLISLNPECDDIIFDKYQNIECKGLVIGKINKSDIIDEE